MKSLNVIYENGHFYDINTQKRIYLKEGEQIVILSCQEFTISNPVNKPHKKLLSSEQIFHQIRKDSKIARYKKLLSEDDFLYFKVKFRPYRDKSKKIQSYLFKLQLKEDLYLYDSPILKKPALYKCKCIVVENIGNEVPFFEKIYAFSVNNAHEKTSTYYFAHHKSPGANVITTCYYYENGKEVFLAKERDKFDNREKNKPSK